MSSFKMLYVYIIRCADASYYTGITNNTEIRIAQHNSGEDPNCYTFKRRPVELMYVEAFQNYEMAIACEKQIKGWSRKKKEALIAGNFDRLKELAACGNPSSHLHYKKPS